MSEDESGQAGRLVRMTTGNAELDRILGGGFPANSINILMGEPGSGKTILAERLMFANANDDGRPIAFLSTLSEPLDKVVRYLQQFRFFDESKLAGNIVYDSIGEALTAHGIGALVTRVKDVIKTHRPKIIVIDSFKAIHDLSTSVPDMRRMLFELAGLLTACETTAFLVGEYSADQISMFPEFAVADSMVELSRHKLGTREERFVRVLKLRGSAYLEGQHAFSITADGLEVFPRLVSPSVPPSYAVLAERVATSVRGLDALLGGGLFRGRSTFVVGPTGSGKTTLALQFVLEGVKRGESCLYVSFEENPTQLDAQLGSMGLDAEDVRSKGLHFLYVSPVELQIDRIVAAIFRAIRQNAIRRIVIDAVGDLFLAATDVHRLHDYLYALTQHFAVEGVSSFFTYESVALANEVQTRLSALSDAILALDVPMSEGRARRTLRVIKARGIGHDLHEHVLRISSTGVGVE